MAACAVIQAADARGVVVTRAQDTNATCSSGRTADCSTRAGRRGITAPVRIKLAPVKRLVHRRALRADAVLVTESWQGGVSHSGGAAEEALALSLAAAKAARDAAAVATSEFPSEFDLLRLERARLTDMEHSFRAVYDAESALLEAEQSYLLKLESLLGGVSSLVEGTTSTREADADSLEVIRGVDVTVKSKRKMERMRRRERALEKAEKVASALASAPPFPKPKKVTIAHDPSDPIRAYLRDIGKTRLLTGSEEITLSRKIQDLLKMERVKTELKREVGREPTISEWSRAVGMEQNAFEERIKDGRHAKDKMVNSNLRLVVSIAKNYQNRGMILQDLIQEGSLGLIRGAEKFDSNRGYKFSTYAHWWIRQAITRAIADQSRIIRLPIHLYEVISRINKAKKMLVQEHGRQARDDEVAELVGLSVEKMQLIIKSARAPSSMERTIGEDGNTTIGELIADKGVESPEDAIAKQLMKQDVDGVLCTLNPREREVLRLRFGLDDGRGKTLEEIGTIFKVTRERIRQIEAKAMRKLRQPSRNSALREYLDVKIA